jgi:hypothetical protein
MYVLKQFKWGSVFEMMQFHEERLPFSEWGIKGHNRPWIIANGNFKKGEKVIEVGGAYSALPQYLSDKFNIEAWVADDFGIESREALWSRWGDREELKLKYPSVNYVFERVGKGGSSIPSGYFDCIYTVSTLEHIPPNSIKKLFDHMCKMLRTGGRMIHCVDLPIPLGIHKSVDVKGILLGTVGYSLYHKTREIFQSVEKPYLNTINGWWRFFKKYFGNSLKIACEGPTGYIMTTLNPDIVRESPDVVYKFYPPNEKAKPYRPFGTFVFILEKQQSDN